MSTIPCSFSVLSDLEELIVELQAHSLALDLLILECHSGWTNTHTCLLYTRLDALRQTAADFCALEDAIWAGHDLPGEPTPEAASDTPSA